MARRNVEWSPEAATDLEDITAFIARDKPAAAERWIERLIARAEQVPSAPRAGRVVPEVGDDSVREVFLGAYRIIYRVEPSRIVVLTVIEGHRRLRMKNR